MSGIATATPGRVTIRGHLVDATTHDPAIGATVVATGGFPREEIAITDETGSFMIDAPVLVTTLTIYYEDTTLVRQLSLDAAAEAVDLGAIPIVVKPTQCCIYEFGPSAPIIDVYHALSVTFDQRWPALRSRDTTSLLPLVASSRPSLTSYLDGGRRLTGAPGLSLALVDEVSVYPLRGAMALQQASDGVAIDTRAGSNENHGGARLAYDNDGAHVEAGAGGPILHDHLWWFAAGDISPAGHQELARIDVTATPEEQGHVLAMHQQVSPGDLRVVDDWADAQWLTKLDDNKLQLTTGVTGERLDDDRDDTGATTRGAAFLRVRQRGKLVGYHDLLAGAEIGAGQVGDDRHHDASGYLGDFYWPVPNVSVDAGVRWDERWFDGAHATVWQPHLTLAYDWTKEARSEIFVAADRASLLDANGIGGWRTLPHARDDLSVGVRYEIAEDVLVSVAGRGSELAGVRKEGVDVQLDHRGRYVELHATATSVERAIAGFVGVTRDRHGDGIVAGIAGRYAFAEDDVFGSQIGGRLAWRHAFTRTLSTTLGGELLHDRSGTLATAVLAFAY